MTRYTKGFDSIVSIFGHRHNPYRFAFNGQEKVDEIAGAGNHNTAEFWEYDTRLGRRWNLDPKLTIGISGYACFGNNPVFFSDLKGDEWDTPASNIPSGSNIPLDMPKYRTGDVGFANTIENYFNKMENNINKNNSITGEPKVNFNKPVFRIYTASDNAFTPYNGDTYIDNSVIITAPKN